MPQIPIHDWQVIDLPVTLITVRPAADQPNVTPELFLMAGHQVVNEQTVHVLAERIATDPKGMMNPDMAEFAFERLMKRKGLMVATEMTIPLPVHLMRQIAVGYVAEENEVERQHRVLLLANRAGRVL